VRDTDQLYFGAVDLRDDGLYATGSRAVAVVGIADTISKAEKIAETEVAAIKGPFFHRKDIGTEALIERRVKQMEMLRQ
jgi:phosphoribosylamine--glycine ligase